MPRNHCLLDANAVVKRYHTEMGSDVINELFEKRKSRRALHMVNVSIPEVIQTFFRLWKDKKTDIDADKRDELKDIFINDIKECNILIHNVTDRNIRATDDMWKVSFEIPVPTFRDPKNRERKQKDPISTPDAIAIAVALEMKSSFGHAYLFTSDEHVKLVARKMGVKVVDPEKVKSLRF
ncbi:type II toxin-antitoxin system VapC family toxin [bacterium]|nr:type II toxin-antitoxin system VapC family toxin [bacterium]